MYNNIEDLKEQMHTQCRVVGHLWYMINKYEEKQLDVDCAKYDIDFLNDRLVHFNIVLEKTKNELEKAEDRLAKKIAELKEFGDIEELKNNYEVENARLYELMEEYKELIKNDNYE